MRPSRYRPRRTRRRAQAVGAAEKQQRPVGRDQEHARTAAERAHLKTLGWSKFDLREQVIDGTQDRRHDPQHDRAQQYGHERQDQFAASSPTRVRHV